MGGNSGDDDSNQTSTTAASTSTQDPGVQGPASTTNGGGTATTIDPGGRNPTATPAPSVSFLSASFCLRVKEWKKKKSAESVAGLFWAKQVAAINPGGRRRS